MKVFPPQGLPPSAAARWEMLIDLYAPMTEQEDGTFVRDTSAGLISREDFVRMLNEPDE